MKIDSLRAKTISLFYILLAIFPFGLGVMASAYHYFYYFQYRIEFFLVLLFGFGLLVLVSRNSLTKRPGEIEIVAFVVLLPVILRWLAMIFFNTQPVSDFLNAFQSAAKYLKGPYEDIYSARFPYWGFYILTLSASLRVLGATITGMKLFNLLISGLTAAGIYYLGKRISNSRKIAIIAAVVYAFWPAEILYKNLPTGEHLFAMLFPYACLFFLNAIQYLKLNIKRSAAYFLLSGLMVGLMDLYKPVGIVLLIAFGISVFFMKYSPNHDSPRFLIVRNLLFRVVLLLALVLPYWAVKEIGYLIVEHEAMTRVNRYGFGSTLRVGLDPASNGGFSLAIQTHIRNLREEHNEDYKVVNDLLLQETVEIIRNHSAVDYLKLFAYKFFFAWRSEGAFYRWATIEQAHDGLTSFDPLNFRSYANPWSDAYFMYLLIFSLAGSLYCARGRRSDLSLCIGLFIFGFSLLLLLSEVQPRYRSVLFSSIPIFAAYGISASGQLISYLERFISTAHEKTA